jgi:hypothetical protein
MRNRKRYVAVVLAAALTGGLIYAAAAWATNASTLSFALGDKSVPKKDFKKESIFVHTSTDTVPPGGFPSPTTSVVLQFDDDIKFTTKGVAKCTADIASMTTAQARAACSSSQIGVGTGTARIPVILTNVPAVITAFNGPKDSSGNPTILLHTVVQTATPVTVVIPGVLKPSSIGGDFGKELDVTVPPTGTALVDFQTTIKKGNYVSARCHDKNNTWNMQALFTYTDTTQETQSATQHCKVS